MCSQWLIDVAAPLESWAKVLGITLGGVWALYRFGLLRKGETALDIDLSYDALEYSDNKCLVTFRVTLANKGSVKLAARKALFSSRHQERGSVAYEDAHESLLYPVDLLVRRVSGPTNGDGSIRWFPKKDSKSPSKRDLELDLLTDYELNGTYTFWMEPKETYHLGATCLMEPGDYLAMVTFVGERDEKDFWRRSFVARIQCSPKKRSTESQ